VETIWTKLPTPHAEIEPVSETRARNGIFCCRDRVAKWADSPEKQEQRPTKEFGRHVFEIAALLRASHTLYNFRVWVVETIWTKLPTPHAEIEPVSETRARNGIFCCRDRAAKWAHSPKIQEQRPR
jgi:hypothetical protein